MTSESDFRGDLPLTAKEQEQDRLEPDHGLHPKHLKEPFLVMLSL